MNFKLVYEIKAVTVVSYKFTKILAKKESHFKTLMRLKEFSNDGLFMVYVI